ncbi:MAG: hypothetical protein KAG82_10855 [Alcanivoracaceae bacterium]|jgi:predicted membrane channel-forming protein YqfA (hemolysin III family)|nr:hypothetical protein [Alcanivoracaceae bacterium]
MLRPLAIALYIANFAWLWLSGASLPDPVAVHFNAFGFADGHSSIVQHMITMSLVIALLALLGLAMPWVIRRTPARWLSMPGVDLNRLPRERVNALMDRFSHGFAVVMALFLLWIQWLTVSANQLVPARLDLGLLYIGMALMMLAMVALTVDVILAFRRADRA